MKHHEKIPHIKIQKIKSWDEKLTTWIGSVPSLVIHTILFASVFIYIALGGSKDDALLLLTTIVSLEAIYLSILIQMSVNRNSISLEEVEEDLEEIQEDIEDIQEGVEDMEEEIEEIQEDIEHIEVATKKL
jgi:low affinity Fe/Cu permease